jgi:hypothetical protein
MKSNVCDRAKVRQPAPHNGYADDAIVTHNTLSADTTHVQVFYPFHPLHGYRLQVLRSFKRNGGAVSVTDTFGKRLKIPVWMLLPEAANISITEQAYLRRDSLLSLSSLLKQLIATENHDTLLQTSDDGCKGDPHGATATVTPGPNRRGTRTYRGGGKSRTGRPHGTHSGDSFSNRTKEDR